MLQILKNVRNAYRRPSPWKPLNHRYRAIFVHVPKNAGQSVEKALFDAKVSHAPLYAYHFYDRVAFRNYFKFAVVRNPLDRMVSAYQFLQGGGRNEVDAAWAAQWLRQHTSFESFCYALSDKAYQRRVLSWQHFRPQWTFLVDIWGRIRLDFIGRFEQLPDHFRHVADRLGVDATLPHVNRSERTSDWRAYYTSTTAKIVKNIYSKDIVLFGYEHETDL